MLKPSVRLANGHTVQLSPIPVYYLSKNGTFWNSSHLRTMCGVQKTPQVVILLKIPESTAVCDLSIQVGGLEFSY